MHSSCIDSSFIYIYIICFNMNPANLYAIATRHISITPTCTRCAIKHVYIKPPHRTHLFYWRHCCYTIDRIFKQHTT